MIIDTQKIKNYILAQLSESSTWQGIGFLVSLFGGYGIGLNWEHGAFIGATISALIKTFFPDKKKPK